NPDLAVALHHCARRPLPRCDAAIQTDMADKEDEPSPRL
nr:hypothetical protein [Tanacetum cinerariifolium]